MAEEECLQLGRLVVPNSKLSIDTACSNQTEMEAVLDNADFLLMGACDSAQQLWCFIVIIKDHVTLIITRYHLFDMIVPNQMHRYQRLGLYLLSFNWARI